MKNKKIKKKYSSFDILGIAIAVLVLFSGTYLIYGVVNSINDEDASISSNKVWCANCQTYHDKETAEQEAAAKLVWCSNCNKYHAPGEE